MKTQLLSATLIALAFSASAHAEGFRDNPLEAPSNASIGLGGYPPVSNLPAVPAGQPGGLPAGNLPPLVPETSDFSGLNLLGAKNGRALISSGTNVAFYSNGDTLFVGQSAFQVDLGKDGVYIKSQVSNKRVWKVGETQVKAAVTPALPVVNTTPTYKITGLPIEITATGQTATTGTVTTGTPSQNGMVR